jgi:Na+/melibiose symporter-like transporter/ADP-heptose:LPS heptosyltransferase
MPELAHTRFVLPSLNVDKADRPRYLVTMYVGIGDAVTVGLAAIDQLVQQDPRAYGCIDVLCNAVQAELFAYDPRVNRVIEASRLLFPPPEVTSWLKGIFPNAETAEFIRFLRQRHYRAVVAGMFAPGLYARLHSRVIAPSLSELWQDYQALRRLEDRPMSKIIRRAINRSFGLQTPLRALSDSIPLFLSSASIAAAAQRAAQWRADMGTSEEPYKLLLVASDTASDVTRPPTALLAQALHSVLEQYQHLIICILPGYTCASSAEDLWQLLSGSFPGRVLSLPALPRATLLETTALLDQADVFVTGDTGLMHLAVTTKYVSEDEAKDSTKDGAAHGGSSQPRNATRIIVLFGGTNPALYGYSQRTTILGRGRREQRAYRPGIAKESYRLKGRNPFASLPARRVAQAILRNLKDLEETQDMKTEKRAERGEGGAGGGGASDSVTTTSLPQQSGKPKKEFRSFKTVLRNKPFLCLWLAQLISQIAFNAANFGMIVILTEVTGSTTMIGIGIVASALPAVPFSMLAGSYVDYVNKRLILWVCNALRALVSGLLVLALLWNRTAIFSLYIMSFFISLITQFFTPAESSSIPLLVGKCDVLPAMSLFSITLTLAQALGFLVLGQLITALVPPFTLFGFLPVYAGELLFFVITVCYVICAILILLIPDKAWKYEEERRKLASISFEQLLKRIIRHDIRETWDLVRENHILFLALIRSVIVMVLLLVVGELAGPFISRVLHLPANYLAVIFGPAGIALVAGGVLMPFLTHKLGMWRTIYIGVFGTAISFVLLPLGQHIFGAISILAGAIFVMSISFFIGFFLDLMNIPSLTQLQQLTPESERGRIFAFQSMLYNAATIPMVLGTGYIADRIGIETVMYGIAVAVLCFQIWAMRYSYAARHKNDVGKKDGARS